MNDTNDSLTGVLCEPNSVGSASTSEYLHQVERFFRAQARERQLRRQVKQTLRLEGRFTRQHNISQSTEH